MFYLIVYVYKLFAHHIYVSASRLSEFLGLVGLSISSPRRASSRDEEHKADADEMKKDEQHIDRLVKKIHDSIELNLGSSKGAAIKKAFEEIDSDGSGSLSPAELQRAMKALKVELTHEELDKLINKFDVSGNGELSYSGKLGICFT